MLDIGTMLITDSMRANADNSMSSDSRVEKVIESLQELYENSSNYKSELDENAESIRQKIRFAVESQREALLKRETELLHSLQNCVSKRDGVLESHQLEIEQLIVDLEGYLALLRANNDSVGLCNEKLQGWVASTMMQASNFCHSYATNGEAWNFTYQDIGHVIDKFGQISDDNKMEESEKTEEDDSIAIVNNGQWLHSDSMTYSPASDIENEAWLVPANGGSQSEISSCDDEGNTDFEEGKWLLFAKSKDECVEEIASPSAASNNTDVWLVASSSGDGRGKLSQNSTVPSDGWLATTPMRGSLPQDRTTEFPECTSDITTWLCSEKDNSTAEIVSVVTEELRSFSLSDVNLSKWLVKDENDDLCKWLTGRSGSKCDSCSAVCPFENAKTEGTSVNRAKWLRNATNW